MELELNRLNTQVFLLSSKLISTHILESSNSEYLIHDLERS